MDIGENMSSLHDFMRRTVTTEKVGNRKRPALERIRKKYKCWFTDEEMVDG